MSAVTISVADRPMWSLSAAVMVYEADGGMHGSAYATVHPVNKVGRPAIGPGVPASREACARIARALGAASTLTGFLPPNLVYLGARSLVWWRPAAPATLFFDTTRSAAGDQADDKDAATAIGKRNGRSQQPGLVFAVTAGHWFVYALKGTARPGPDTPLLRAPYFNVWESGEICTGNVRLPTSLSTGALDHYERAFFDSEFTHPNLSGRAQLVRHAGGAYDFWRERLDAKPDAPFPVARLVDLNLTIAGLAKRLEAADRR